MTSPQLAAPVGYATNFGTIADDAELPPPPLPGSVTYYGIQVVSIGEDQDQLIMGHHGDRVTVAAFNAHARKEHGQSSLFGDENPGDYQAAVAHLARRWAVLEWSHTPPCDPAKQCKPCDPATSGWVITYADTITQATPGAIPVTMWIN